MNQNISSIKCALDDTAKKMGYSCKNVSWEDVQRTNYGNNLSCFGLNISDVRLWEKNDTLLYTLRSDNWNGKIGYVSSKDISVIVGNNESSNNKNVEPLNLCDYLQNIGKYGSYSGIDPSSNLDNPDVDDIFSIRFQTVFLPIEDDKKTEFCTEVYNYNTRDDSNPRNLLLLCTPQGTSIQQDGYGRKKLYFHNVNESGDIERCWLEATKSNHKVGGSQIETEEERIEAQREGKATSIHIGTEAMGSRFNVQMLVQLPIKQENRHLMYGGGQKYKSKFDKSDDDWDIINCGYPKNMPDNWFDNPYKENAVSTSFNHPMGINTIAASKKNCSQDIHINSASQLKGFAGKSNAARVSVGSNNDIWKGVEKKYIKRDPNQHGTITVTLYYTVENGVPSESDIISAIKDLEELYSKCSKTMKLKEAKEITYNPEELPLHLPKNMYDNYAKYKADISSFPSFQNK